MELSYYLFVSILMIISLIIYSTKLFVEGDWMAGITFVLVLVAVSLKTITDFIGNNDKE